MNYTLFYLSKLRLLQGYEPILALVTCDKYYDGRRNGRAFQYEGRTDTCAHLLRLLNEMEIMLRGKGLWEFLRAREPTDIPDTGS